MGWFDGLMGAQAEVPTHVPSPTEPRDLVLFKFNACPYCARVMRKAESLGLTLAMRDTRSERDAAAELSKLTGKTQVPCLVIDGKPLLESADIVAWLTAYKAAVGSTDASS